MASGQTSSERWFMLTLFAALLLSWGIAAPLALWSALSEAADDATAFAAAGFTVLCGIAIVTLAVRERSARREEERFRRGITMLTDPALARLTPREAIDECLHRTREVLGADATALLLMSDRDHKLEPHAVRGRDDVDIRVAIGEGVWGQVAARGEPALISEQLEKHGPALLGDRARGFVGCPVIIEGDVRGVVGAESTAGHRFNMDDVQLLRRVAERIGTAVERAAYDEIQREAMDAVAEGEHRVRTLVEAAPIGIVETDVSGKVARWNRTAAAMLAWPRWLVGSEPPVPLPFEVRDAMDLAAEGRRTERLTTRVERPGARTADLVVTVAPVTSREGTVDSVLVLFDDITERQQMEAHVRQAQRLEAMGRLAGGVAHGFNNLLTVILGYSEVLMRTLDEDDERREDLQAIRTAGQQATELTQQLLSIGRKPVVEPEIIDGHQRVRHLEPVLRRLAGDEIELRIVTATEAGKVRIDPTEFDQAVMNLVINARDASPSGGRIVVETRRLGLRGKAAAAAGVRSGQYLMLTVADTGSGMPPDVLDHCFDPFFTTKGPGKGTGIGLAAVYGTVTGGGGQVTVESEVGRGTTFRLWFPVVESEATTERKSTGARPARKRKGPSGRVLIVDDEAPVRNLARAILEEAGHVVVDAASGIEALVKADTNPPFDVVVSDIVMPRMRGDEMVRRLKERFPQQRVVLMSAHADHASEVEPDVFLRKPFALDELVAVVGDLVRQRRRPAAKRARAKADPATTPETSEPVTKKAAGGATARSGSRRRAPS